MRIPGPKWGAGRPPLETPKSRCAIRIGRTPRRFAAGASVPLGKAASACALAPIAAPPPLRLGASPPCPLRSQKGKVCRSCALVGGFAPLPPGSPLGDVCRSCALVGGLRPLAPRFPAGRRLPVMRACWGLTLPLPPRFPNGKSLLVMRECAWYRVRNGFAGNAFANLAEAPAATRLGVPSLPSRELRPKAAPARPQ